VALFAGEIVAFVAQGERAPLSSRLPCFRSNEASVLSHFVYSGF